jgi:hypothetical protein
MDTHSQPSDDMEKQAVSHHLDNAGPRHPTIADAALEARVVRKIDMRLVPLVTALCKIPLLTPSITTPKRVRIDLESQN